jgi:hypothetical protein
MVNMAVGIDQINRIKAVLLDEPDHLSRVAAGINNNSITVVILAGSAWRGERIDYIT